MARLYMSIFTALIMLFLTLASGIGLLVFGKQFPYKGFYAATAESFHSRRITPPYAGHFFGQQSAVWLPHQTQ